MALKVEINESLYDLSWAYQQIRKLTRNDNSYHVYSLLDFQEGKSIVHSNEFIINYGKKRELKYLLQNWLKEIISLFVLR